MASRMRIPRQYSVVPLYEAEVSLLPEKDAPSQYRIMTWRGDHKSATVVPQMCMPRKGQRCASN
jgi:hypothetical protein